MKTPGASFTDLVDISTTQTLYCISQKPTNLAEYIGSDVCMYVCMSDSENRIERITCVDKVRGYVAWLEG